MATNCQPFPHKKRRPSTSRSNMKTLKQRHCLRKKRWSWTLRGIYFCFPCYKQLKKRVSKFVTTWYPTSQIRKKHSYTLGNTRLTTKRMLNQESWTKHVRFVSVSCNLCQTKTQSKQLPTMATHLQKNKNITLIAKVFQRTRSRNKK